MVLLLPSFYRLASKACGIGFAKISYRLASKPYGIALPSFYRLASKPCDVVLLLARFYRSYGIAFAKFLQIG